jgi:hypothetical protein
MNKVTHPIIIDIEASGFGGASYPIEVGLVMEDGKKFCSLILPAPEWTHWDEEAEKVHNIERSILEVYGKEPKEVATLLNELLDGKTVYTDGWVVDKPWITTLFYEAGINMSFEVSSLEMILSESQMENWHKTKDQVIKDLDLSRHRASYDALIIQETYKRTLKMFKNTAA